MAENEEILLKPFDFPKNLKEMTWEEREKLAEDYLRHLGPVPNSAELNPSKVLLPESIEYRAKVLIKKNPSKFSRSSPQIGQEPKTVSRGTGGGQGNNFSSMSKGMLEEAMKEVIIGDYREKIARMQPVEREVEERFGDI